MARGRVKGIALAMLLMSLVVACSAPAAAQSSIPGISVVLPNVVDVTLKLPTITLPTPNNPVVTLPSLNLPSITLLQTAGLPAGLNLPDGDTLLLLNLPGISVVVPNVPELAALGNGVLGVVLDQVGSVNQLLAATTNINLLGPIGGVINGLIGDGGLLGGGSSSDNLPGANGGVVSLSPLPLSSLWMWNAVTLGTSTHGGYQFRAGSGADAATGTTLPIRSTDRADTPGILLDASSLMGLRRGSFHVGISAGVAESDLDIRGDKPLRQLGIKTAGSANLKAWSVGGFALLTTRAWYAGSTVGGTWGRAETDNFLTTAASDFDGSSIATSLFTGKVFAIADLARLDVRGALGYQRTVGDAHHDTVGIAYGDHTIEVLDGTVSARLLGVLPAGGTTLRPYLQAGVTHRFYYANELDIAGVPFAFDDADTSLFTAAGVDVEINQTLQLSVGIRQDHSPDYDALSGRFGILLKLN